MSMTAEEVIKLIQQGQNEYVAWLAPSAPLQTIAETLLAFANSHGGTLLLGLDTKGEVVGVDDTVEYIDKVLQASLMLSPQLIIPLPQLCKLHGKTIVVTQIPRGMPHVYSLEGRYLYRIAQENAPLSPRKLRHLMIERGELSFEMQTAPHAELDDIDWSKAAEYAKRLGALGDGDIQTILFKRGCLAKEGNALFPTNAGILLFGKDPQRFVQGSEITAVRFAGETMSDTFSRQDITGTLPEQIRKAETFLIDYLRKDVMLKDRMVREENYEYPLEAVRELVVNAVAHRAYHISGDGIRLYIFSNRLEINSPGGLPGPVTVNNIKDERFSRNPAIVQVLSDMGFIERLGYGVDRVIELMREHGLQAPSFEDRASGFKVVLYNTTTQQESTQLQTQPAIKQEEATLAFNGVYNGQEINPRQETALIHLHQVANQRITNREFQQLCPDVHAETIRRDLVDLVNKGILKKLGQKRGSYYVLAQPTTEIEENAE